MAIHDELRKLRRELDDLVGKARILASRIDELEQTDRLRDDEALHHLWEAITLHKFLDGNLYGLDELAGYDHLSPSTIAQLLQVALEDYEVGSATFNRILQIALEKSQLQELQQTEQTGG